MNRVGRFDFNHFQNVGRAPNINSFFPFYDKNPLASIECSEAINYNTVN